MDKNDMSKSLILKIIADIKQDIKLLSSNFNNRTVIERLGEKVNMLEKMINVIIINEAKMSNNAEPEQPPIIDGNAEPPIVPDRIITQEELAFNDGRDGRPTYVAYQGVVYDVSGSPLWSEGTHFGIPAGRDNTIEYRACHASRPRVEDMPAVGILEVDPS